MALAYAQYLTCDSPLKDDSCGVCPPCKQHQTISYPDLHFSFVSGKKDGVKVASSSNFLAEWRKMLQKSPFCTSSQWLLAMGLENKNLQIGVDEAKTILADFSLKSYSGNKKILVLWMPEAMHRSAANKLLKFIEEPLNGSVIILVSHNQERVLPTILSRVQQTRVPQHSFSEIVNHLIQKENKSQEEAEIAALAAHGNLSEALEIVSNPEREMGFAENFVKWMRFAVMANLPELIRFSETVGKKDKDSVKGFLRFSLKMVDHCLQLRYLSKPTGDAIFESVGFKIEKFAPYITPKNAPIFYTEINKAIHDIEGYGNVKLILLDTSVEVSKALRIK